MGCGQPVDDGFEDDCVFGLPGREQGGAGSPTRRARRVLPSTGGPSTLASNTRAFDRSSRPPTCMAANASWVSMAR